MRSSRALGILVCIVAGVLPATPARASFHLIKITEVYGGASNDPEAQYVEIQTYASDQTFLAGRRIAVFDAAGAEGGSFEFTRNLSNGAEGAYALVATPEAEATLGVTADLHMDPVIDLSGGRICFLDDMLPIDCVSWGSYSGESSGTGTPFNAPAGLELDRSIDRVVDRGTDPERLDRADDTDDSATDFLFATPSPSNNARGARFEREITLHLKRSLIAGGRIVGLEDIRVCADHVPLAVQRKTDDGWRTLKRVETDDRGRYRVSLRDRRGRYRAVAIRTVEEDGPVCARAVSRSRLSS